VSIVVAYYYTGGRAHRSGDDEEPGGVRGAKRAPWNDEAHENRLRLIQQPCISYGVTIGIESGPIILP
jgi:hypothetical protein